MLTSTSLLWGEQLTSQLHLEVTFSVLPSDNTVSSLFNFPVGLVIHSELQVSAQRHLHSSPDWSTHLRAAPEHNSRFLAWITKIYTS